MKLTAKQLAQVYLKTVEDSKDVNKSAEAFIAFLAEQRQVYEWRSVVRAVNEVWKEKYGVSRITVQSAHELSKKAEQALEKASKGADLIITVDETLLSGAVIRIDDRIIDTSAKGQLEKMKSYLLAS